LLLELLLELHQVEWKATIDSVRTTATTTSGVGVVGEVQQRTRGGCGCCSRTSYSGATISIHVGGAIVGAIGADCGATVGVDTIVHHLLYRRSKCQVPR